jgi:hypothetical protein
MLPQRIYRRRHGEALWHCCKNCNRWPRDDYEETVRRPHEMALCGPCRRLTLDLLCDPVYPREIVPPSEGG